MQYMQQAPVQYIQQAPVQYAQQAPMQYMQHVQPPPQPEFETKVIMESREVTIKVPKVIMEDVEITYQVCLQLRARWTGRAARVSRPVLVTVFLESRCPPWRLARRLSSAPRL